MIKTKKNILLALLSVFLALSVVFLFNPFSVFASTNTTTQGESFSFTEGARARFEDDENGKKLYTLNFRLNTVSPRWVDINDGEGTYKTNSIGKISKDYFIYSFRLYDFNSESDKVLLKSYDMYFHYVTTDVMAFYTFEKSERLNAPGFRIVPRSIVSTSNKFDLGRMDTITSEYKNKGMELTNYSCLTATDFTYFDVFVDTETPYAQYSIGFSYKFNWMSERGLWSKYDNFEESETEFGSVNRSVYTILKGLETAGTLESEFPDTSMLEHAREIITNEETETVTVQYLKLIDGTPFYTSARAELTLPVINGTFLVSDVEDALGVGLDAVNSYVYKFEEIDGVHYARYLKNTVLKAQTTDGNTVEVYLDINESYESFFKKFVNDGILPEDGYQVMYSHLIDDYPVLRDYAMKDVYGAFGFVTIPDGTALGDLWARMFSSTTNVGATYMLSYDSVLSLASYVKLRDQYEYSFLANVWDVYLDVLTAQPQKASYYCLYTTPGTQFALISEAGNTNPEQPPNDANDNDTLKGIGGWLDGVFGGLFGAMFGSQGSTITSIIVIGLIVVVVIWVRNRRR